MCMFMFMIGLNASGRNNVQNAIRNDGWTDGFQIGPVRYVYYLYACLNDQMAHLTFTEVTERNNSHLHILI
jgi:hypothetical protein